MHKCISGMLEVLVDDLEAGLAIDLSLIAASVRERKLIQEL